MIKNNLLSSKVLLTALSLATLTGCGGGTETNTTVDNTTLQPHQLSARDLQNVDMFAATSVVNPTVTTDPENNTITITRTGTFNHLQRHYQFFLNVDNDANTGFRFDNEVWDDAGTDYIVEDGRLFKSTANDSSWSWDEDIGPVTYTEGEHEVSVTIDQSLLKGLGPIIRAGFITRNLDWSVRHIYPQSSLMNEYILDVIPPEDTTPPVITLNGSSTMEIPVNGAFTDPGATAKDNIDGDISSKITISDGNLNLNKIGTYQILYRVRDAAHNLASIARTIKVVGDSTTGITIDGDNGDWNDIPVLTETGDGILKVTDTEDSLYLLYIATRPYLFNTQFLLDTDYDASTGYIYNGTSWNIQGADYMVENNHLDKYKPNPAATWSWDYNSSPIDFVKRGFTIEVRIPKSALHNLGDNINIGFVRRDNSWNTEATLPQNGMTSYSLSQEQTAQLTLLPRFCGNVWETKSTPESTQISPFNNRNSNDDLIIKHQGEWYGVEEGTNEGTGETEINIFRYDGIRNMQFLPLHLVRDAPLGESKITDMTFLGETLYFVFGDELWASDGSGPGTRIVKKFEGSSIHALYPSRNFIAIHTNDTVNDQTWIMNTAPNSLEQVFLVDIIDARPLFTNIENNAVYLTDDSDYYKSDYTHSHALLDYIPLSSYEGNLYVGNYDETTNEYTVSVFDNGSPIATKLDTFLGLPTKIRRVENESHMYLSFINEIGTSNQYIWLLNFRDNTFKRVDREHVSFPSSSSPRGMSVYRVAGNDYSIWLGGRYQSTTLYRLNGVGDDNSLNRTPLANLSRTSPGTPDVLTGEEYFYWNGSLYFTFIKENIDTTKFIGVINDSSGKIKELGSCH